MRPAARYFAIGFAGALLTACAVPATEPVPRSAPSRPAAARDEPPVPALSAYHAPATENVSVIEIAAKLGLKGTWIETGRKIVFSDRARRLVLEADRRETEINGLRVFLGSPVVARHGQLYVSTGDFERCLVPLLRPALIGAPSHRPKVIVLDPGHGGADNGMENPKLRLKEKELTLDVALRLEKLLEARGYTIVLTRTGDRPLSPDKKTDFKRRDELANRAGADLFVSIHFNSLYPDTKTSGTEVYVFTRTGQRSDRALGFGEEDDTERESAPVNRHDAWSAVLAQALHRDVIASLKTLDRGQKTMHSAVLRGLDCPGVLVESLFLSNDAEARRAAAPAYRQQIAEALCAGIADYADVIDSLRPKP